MQVFYASNISGTEVLLEAEESLHLSKVLRLKAGEIVGLMDGKGSLYEAVVAFPHAKESKLSISKLLEKQERKRKLHIAIAPTKSMERFEWFLEKAVEIGIDRITPLVSQRSERVVLKKPRMEKIILSAMKQSRQAWMPQLDELISTSDFLTKPHEGLACIAHCGAGPKESFYKIQSDHQNMLVLIGPEGDFTPHEIAQAIENGFTSVSLGDSRLRTETAAIMVCAAVKIEAKC